MVNIIYDKRSIQAIGNRLLIARTATNTNQIQFASAANIAQNTYNQYENGKKKPSVDYALRICDSHELTLDWIFTGNPSGLSVRIHKPLIDAEEKLDSENLIPFLRGTNIHYNIQETSAPIGFHDKDHDE